MSQIPNLWGGAARLRRFAIVLKYQVKGPRGVANRNEAPVVARGLSSDARNGDGCFSKIIAPFEAEFFGATATVLRNVHRRVEWAAAIDVERTNRHLGKCRRR